MGKQDPSKWCHKPPRRPGEGGREVLEKIGGSFFPGSGGGSLRKGESAQKDKVSSSAQGPYDPVEIERRGGARAWEERA